MLDPYATLGLPADSDDDTIRRRYLQLVRQYPPEREPEKFASIRKAYDALRDTDTRLRYRLFEAGKSETVEALVEEITCRSSRARVSLEKLLSVLKQS